MSTPEQLAKRNKILSDYKRTIYNKYKKFLEEDDFEKQDVKNLMEEFATKLVHDIYSTAGPNGIEFPTIRSAFSYFFVKIVNVYLMIDNYESPELSDIYKFSDVLENRCSVDEYFRVHRVNPDFFYELGEIFFYDYQDLVVKYKKDLLYSMDLMLKVLHGSLMLLLPFAESFGYNLVNQEHVIKRNSVDALFFEAKLQGWFINEMTIIPGLEKFSADSSSLFMDFIMDVKKEDPDDIETMTFHVCRYLFAKAVEATILWGHSADGKFSVFIDPKHLIDGIEFEVSEEDEAKVLEALSIGESLFVAHQNFIKSQQKKGERINLYEETEKMIHWIPRLGVTYALFNGYHGGFK